MKPCYPGLLVALLCSGCDPAASLLLRAQVPSGEEARSFAAAELKDQRFEPRPQQNAKPTCSYMWRYQTESTYPRATWTTYADVCASETTLRIRLSDYPRLTLSPETAELRDHMKKTLTQRFNGIDVIIE